MVDIVSFGVQIITLDIAFIGESGFGSPPYGGWEIVAQEPFSDDIITIDVNAVCFDNPPLRP